MVKINILLVDDNDEKSNRIETFLKKNTDKLEYDNVSNITDCMELLRAQQYDILLLDLHIPLRKDDASPENAIFVINEINRDKTIYNSPAHIIIHSEFDEKLKKKEDELNMYELMHFELKNNAWETQLSRCIEHCYKFKNYYQSIKEEISVDVVLITALNDPELKQVLELNGGRDSWVEQADIDEVPYYTTKFTTYKGEELNVVAVVCERMGMVAATDLTNKVLKYFNPKSVIMSGIAAGFKGNFGDILIAESCYDHGYGKLETQRNKDGEEEEVFQPDIKQIPIESKLNRSLKKLKSERNGLDEIQSGWAWDDTDEEIKILHESKNLGVQFGEFASGAAVVASKKYIKKNLKAHGRNLIGIDMEAFGVFYACEHSNNPNLKYFLSIKSVSDNGDSKKNDKHQDYAAYTSARYIYYLLTETDLLKFE